MCKRRYCGQQKIGGCIKANPELCSDSSNPTLDGIRHAVQVYILRHCAATQIYSVFKMLPMQFAFLIRQRYNHSLISFGDKI